MSWYAIRNKAPGETEISIFDEIGFFGISAERFVQDLAAVPADSRIHLRIHSPGGEVFDGTAIYHALLRHKGGVTVQIEGLAASMATVIALAGAPVKMAANGFWMIHNPAGGTFGESEEMRKMADLLDDIRDNIANIYAAKTGKPRDEILALMAAETWFTAAQAAEAGFVDEITEAVPLAACAFSRLKKFSAVPAHLTNPTSVMTAQQTPAEPAVDPAQDPAPVTDPVVDPAPVADPAPVEDPATEPEPEPAAEPTTTPEARVTSLSLLVTALRSERDAALARATSAEASLSKVSTDLEVLERSLGVASARVVPAIAPTNVEASDPVSAWLAAHARGDKAAAAALYAKHKTLIHAHREKISPAQQN